VKGEDATPGINRRAITATVICACVMQGLDQTIVNVSLPHIQGSMSASQDEISWVLTSYIVASAIAMPLVGWLADRPWRQISLSCVRDRLNRRFGVVRRCNEPNAARTLSFATGGM
jgi:MFS family permease